jgi:hypothetical protein
LVSNLPLKLAYLFLAKREDEVEAGGTIDDRGSRSPEPIHRHSMNNTFTKVLNL